MHLLEYFFFVFGLFCQVKHQTKLQIFSFSFSPTILWDFLSLALALTFGYWLLDFVDQIFANITWNLMCLKTNIHIIYMCLYVYMCMFSYFLFNFHIRLNATQKISSTRKTNFKCILHRESGKERERKTSFFKRKNSMNK